MTDEISLASLHSETSTVPWRELQRLFAAGMVITISPELDLVETALFIAKDDKDSVQRLIDEDLIHHVTNDEARSWYEDDRTLWSVVVKPWVLVQDRRE